MKLSGFSILFLLVLFSVPANGAVILGPESRVSPVSYGPALLQNAAFASDGRDSLAVGTVGARVVAVRVSGAGSPLDPNGIEVFRSLEPGYLIGCWWNGATYVVTWTLYRGRPEGSGSFETFTTRISRDGIAEPPRRISVVSADRLYPVVAGATRQIQIYEISHRLYAILYDSELNELGRGIPIPGGRGQGNASVASSGHSFLVAWEDFKPPGYDVWATRLTDEGVPLDGEGIYLGRTTGEISGAGTQPRSLWNGVRWIVAWNEEGIISRAIEENGVPGTPVRVDRITSSVELRLSTWGIAGARSGTETLLTWVQTSETSSMRTSSLREALIAENGSVIDEATTIAKVSGFQYLIQQTAVETVASSAVVSWDLGMYFLPPPFTSSPELRKLDIPVLVRSANRQEEPVVTSTGSLIAWTERGSISYQGYYSVYRGDRVKFTLAPTEGGPRALAISNGVSDQIAPRVAEGSDGYLITWLQLDRPSIHEVRFQLHARRVSRAGVVLGGDDLVISDRPVSGFHEVVWNGSRFVVFWSEEGSLRRTIVSRDGAVGDSTEIARGFPLAAASSGGHSLVLFAQFSADDHSLRMLRLNANAELEADPAVLEESASSADVAAASGGWVLIYSHGDNSTVAQFLSLGGALAKPAEILSFTGPVHVAVSGEQVMVASSRFSYSARPVLHLTVLRLNDDTLTLLDSRSDEPALNFADPGPQVAGRDGGKFLLVYSRPSPEVDQSPSVIFDRLASIGPRPRGARH